MKKIPMIGNKYGRLTVLEEAGRISGHLAYACKCDCGNQTTVTGPNLRNENTKSCGCLRSEETNKRLTKHNRSHSVEYSTWSQMKRRCFSTDDIGYHRYGGRGITVCERWMSFENFYADMGSKPFGMTLERIDVNKDYEPSNCTWATREDQAKNKRMTIKLTYDGMTMCLKDWSKKIGKPYTTMLLHYKRGYSTENILGVAA